MNDYLLALAGVLTGLLYLAREQGRVAGVKRGFVEQLHNQEALLQRRAAVVTELLDYCAHTSKESLCIAANDLDRLAAHQVQAEHACSNLGRNAGDHQALEAFKASGIQMAGFCNSLILASDSDRTEHGLAFKRELERLDEWLTTQSETTVVLAQLLERTRRRPVARLSGLVAHFGLLPSWG